MMTRDGKIVCVEVTRPDTHLGLSCIYRLDAFNAADELDGAEPGDSVVLTLREMTEQEIADLPDFEGLVMEDPKDYGIPERLRAGDDVYFYPEGERATEVNNPIVWPWNGYSILYSPRRKS